jgi:hypothetical protein
MKARSATTWSDGIVQRKRFDNTDPVIALRSIPGFHEIMVEYPACLFPFKPRFSLPAISRILAL